MEEVDQKNLLLGEFLRQSREKSGYSLQEVARLTRINIAILQNLENNQFAEFPSISYVKGFSRSYIKMIKGDTHKLDNILEVLFGKKIIEVEIPLPKKNPPSSLIIPKILKTKGISLVLLIPLGLFIWWLVPQKETTLPTPPSKILPSQSMEPILPLSTLQDPIPFTEKSSSNSSLGIASIHTVTPKNNPTSLEEKTLEAPAPFIKITSPLYEVLPQAAENNDHSLLPERILNKSGNETQKVFINAYSGDTWLAFKKDQDPIRNFTLKQGETHYIAGNEILLFIGNIGATKIFYNHQLIKPIAPFGIKNFIFPQESRQKYLLPLFVRDDMGIFFTSIQYLEKLKNGEKPSLYYQNLFKKKNSQ